MTSVPATSTVAPPPSLRRRLSAVPPHVSMKVALRVLIQRLREASRLPGAVRHPLASRQALERCLARTEPVAEADLTAIKDGLRRLLQAEDGGLEQALRVADTLQAVVPSPIEAGELCTLRVHNRPPQLSDMVLRMLLGCDEGTVTAEAASLARHRVHGLMLGGSVLQVEVHLAPGRCLPAVSRDLRGDPGRRGRAAPWLPELDDVGRFSLTPRWHADRMAQRVLPLHGRVWDACCGCGGNAVAFALAGAQVEAVERNSHRAELARRNARAFGVQNRVTVHTGSIEDHLAHRVVGPADLLFVDPPWDDEHGTRANTFGKMFRELPRLADAVAQVPRVLLKLPRTFDLSTLPGGVNDWRVSYELGREETGDAHVVRMIAAIRAS